VKAVISYVSGTKPYIYQWMNKATLKVTVPESVIPGESGEIFVEGDLYTEASFVS